jgi:hypothetical protein
MASLQSFRSLIFVDANNHAHYTLYNLAGLIFVDSRLSAKTVKIGSHENSCYTVEEQSTFLSTLTTSFSRTRLHLHYVYS